MTRFTDHDLTWLDQQVREVARATVMRWFRCLPDDAVRAKSHPADLVTIADELAEEALSAQLRARYPAALIVGEEAASQDLALIDRLHDADLAFVIDPIDGTANFAAGLPLFATIVAVVVAGETVASVIYDPVCDSASVALRGAGAFELGRGERRALSMAPAPGKFESLRGMASWRFADATHRAAMMANIARLSAHWDHRCAAHEYRALAAGHSDFVFFNRLLPWDHLAGVLLAEEAGGAHMRLDGSRYRPGQRDGGLIVAADIECCRLIRRELFGAVVM